MTDTERLRVVGEKMKVIYPLVRKALSEARNLRAKDKLTVVEPLDHAEALLQGLGMMLKVPDDKADAA